MWAIYDAWDEDWVEDDGDSCDYDEAQNIEKTAYRPFRTKPWGRFPGLGNNSVQQMVKITDSVRTHPFSPIECIHLRTVQNLWQPTEVPFLLPSRKEVFIRVRMNRGQYSVYWLSKVPIFTSSYQFSKSSLFFQLSISTPPQPMVELSLSNLKDGILRNLGLRSSIYATISSRVKRCFRCHGEFFVLMFASHVSRHH